jgi:hypothetical protein
MFDEAVSAAGIILPSGYCTTGVYLKSLARVGVKSYEGRLFGILL